MSTPLTIDGGPRRRTSSPLNPNSSSSPSTPTPPPTTTGQIPSFQRNSSNPSHLLSHAGSAAEARAVENRDGTVDLDNLINPSERLQFFRCIDTDILPSSSNPTQRAKALIVMQTLLTLLTNALEKGLASVDGDAQGDLKYLSVKLSNPTIRKKLDLDSKVSKEGSGSPALDYLHLCGWRLRVRDFQEYIEFSSSATAKQIAELKLGSEILQERVNRENKTASRIASRQKAAKEDEEGRKGKALLQIKEDRLRRKEVDEREKDLRARRAEAALLVLQHGGAQESQSGAQSTDTVSDSSA